MRKMTLMLSIMALLVLGATAAIATHVFPDVEDDNTHADNIYWAEDNGVVLGYEDGNFGPDDFIKRDQATSMFKRYHNAFPPVPGEDGADGADGSPGANGAPGEDATLGISYVSNTETVTDIGGTFGKFGDDVRATELGTFNLDPGTHVISADGFFNNNEELNYDGTRMQLALRVDDVDDNATGWGLDYGTCFTGAISVVDDRDATCNTTRAVTLTESETVTVLAFGYNDDESNKNSGSVSATAFISAVSVNN